MPHDRGAIMGNIPTKEKAPAVTGRQARAEKAQEHSTAISTADDAVMQAFIRGEWLTAWEAAFKYGCKRFHALMTELRRMGWLFYDEWVSGQNRYGNDARWKRYKLIKAGA